MTINTLIAAAIAAGSVNAARIKILVDRGDMTESQAREILKNYETKEEA